jgi:demethylmenaquinone methyltransferase/2-methoxy-6-polyprenyl-1,4-benzoquinol methylase
MFHGSLYDFLAQAYDPVFESIYRPFRTRALQLLPAIVGASVLDLACGTGQNFPFLAARIGASGKIIGVDISSGMLKRARLRAARGGMKNVSLLHFAAHLNSAVIQEQVGVSSFDAIICTYGLTSMREWAAAFPASWNLLKPGGHYLIHDIDAATPTFHSRVVELATRSHFSQKVWQPLQRAAVDFRMDYLDPSAHLFGGRLFAALGTKPFA